MDSANRIFLEQLARDVDYWAKVITEAATDPSADLFPYEEYAGALRVLHGALVTPEARRALHEVLFHGMCGLVHSILVNTDGGGPLADHYTVAITTSRGETLDPWLHELFFEHLYETGRLPYKSPYAEE